MNLDEDREPVLNVSKDATDVEVKLNVGNKPKKRMKPFTEDLLISDDGLLRIYEEFPHVSQLKGMGNEKQDISHIIGLYKEWAFQLHPGLSLPDILSRTEVLGVKPKIRGFVDTLRNIERNRYMDDVLKMQPPPPRISKKKKTSYTSETNASDVPGNTDFDLFEASRSDSIDTSHTLLTYNIPDVSYETSTAIEPQVGSAYESLNVSTPPIDFSVINSTIQGSTQLFPLCDPAFAQFPKDSEGAEAVATAFESSEANLTVNKESDDVDVGGP